MLLLGVVHCAGWHEIVAHGHLLISQRVDGRFATVAVADDSSPRKTFSNFASAPDGDASSELARIA